MPVEWTQSNSQSFQLMYVFSTEATHFSEMFKISINVLFVTSV